MKTAKLFVIIAVAMAFVASAAVAMAADKPAYKPFHTIVDAAFVKQVVDGKVKGVLIDSRPKRKKYDKGHIPTAISMSDSKFKKMAAKVLPQDKKALIIFYCQGLKCSLSHKSAYKAEGMGYTNVKVYALGYPDWKKHYGPGPGDKDLKK